MRGAAGAKVGDELKALVGGGGGQEEGAWRAEQQVPQATSPALEGQEEMEAQGWAQQGVESGEGDPKRMGRVTQSGGEWQAVAE